jgi:hypothetical protein
VIDEDVEGVATEAVLLFENLEEGGDGVVAAGVG